VKHFPVVAAFVEGSLLPVAIGLGWLVGTRPLATLHLNWHDALLGLAATLPLLVLLWLGLKCPWRPLAEIKRITNDMLLPLFESCGLLDLAVIATLAGIGEETLFRGMLQAALANEIGGLRGLWLGLFAASVLFGLLHAITPAYAAWAALTGLYLGGLWLATGNLLAPIIAHAAYDFLAIAYLMKRRDRGP
jgi:uncharacterized protein